MSGTDAVPLQVKETVASTPEDAPCQGRIAPEDQGALPSEGAWRLLTRPVSQLTVLDGRFAVCRLDGEATLPGWFALEAPFAAAVRRGGELSLVVPEGAVPDGDAGGARVERGWAALEVAGPMAFTLTGVLAGIAGPLADAGVPVFALATYDTDVVLVPGTQLAAAVAALRATGHTVD
jgi:uncharacterized protein